MKKGLLFIVVLFSFVGTWSQVVFKNDEVTVSKLKDKTWVFETWDFTTMYLLEGNDKAALIDAGTRCADLDKIVESITNKPYDVIITHAHPDHAGCIGYFDEVWMHRNDSILIKERTVNYTGKVRYMEEGQVFDLGGRKLEVMLMAGHTPGSIVLLDREQGDCYSGDAFGSGEVWLQCVPMSPIETFYQSCCRMEKLMTDGSISRIWCGHYPYLKNYLSLSYIQTMKKMSRRLADGEQNGARPYNNFAIPQPSTTRSISDGFCKIVYDVRNIVIKRKSIDSHHAIILDRLPKVEQEAYMYRDTCTQVDGRFAGFSPFFLIYPDKRCDVTQAESLIKEMGMDSILHKFSASVCVMNPLGNTYDMEKDLSAFQTFFKGMRVVNNLKVIGIGQGATFVNKAIARNAEAVAGIVTIGGNPGKYELDDCPVPTFVAGARSKQVTNSYVKLNKAVKTAVKGNLTFYVNTDEELLQVVSSSDTSASLKETFLEAWVQVLSKNYRFNNYKHTWYMGGTPEKYGTYELEPYIMPEEWGITRLVMETNLLGTGTFLWYEFHPEATLKAPRGTVPLLLLLHGNENDPRTQAETSGFIELCAKENFVVVELEWQGSKDYARMGMDGIEQVVYYLLKTYPQLDASRVYTEGLSAGSATSTGLGIRKSYLFAAVGGFSAGILPGSYRFDCDRQSLLGEAIQKSGAVEMPYFSATGTSDTVVPFINKDNWQKNAFFAAWQIYQIMNGMSVTERPDFSKDTIFGITLENRETIWTNKGISMETGVLSKNGVPLIQMVAVNDYGHWNFKPAAKMMWDYFMQFSRDPQTKELIYHGRK